MKSVYLLKNIEESSYKIGVAKDPNLRLRNVQTGNSCKIVIADTFLTSLPYKVETALHNQYSHCRKEGEWFDLSIMEEVNFTKNCEKIEKNLKFLIESGNVFI